MPDDISLEPVWLSLELAAVTTVVLLILAAPLAWWLARTKSAWRAPVGAVVTLPLVLPPSVLGFYILVALGPHGPLGQLTQSMGLGLLTFTFPGLVIGSLIYSLPFAVQPLQAAFEALGERPAEVAATLGAKPIDAFFSVVLPLVRPGIFTALVLTFAHTIGEFGVVLMIRLFPPRSTPLSKRWNTIRPTGLRAACSSFPLRCFWHFHFLTGVPRR